MALANKCCRQIFAVDTAIGERLCVFAAAGQGARHAATANKAVEHAARGVAAAPHPGFRPLTDLFALRSFDAGELEHLSIDTQTIAGNGGRAAFEGVA